MIEVIPAIDMIGGKCVRLTHGDFGRKTVYTDEPLELAKRFDAAGIERLHLVDLDGAKAGKLRNLSVLEELAANTSLAINFGGGIKSDADIASVFNAGASKATIGSVAVKEPDLFLAWLKKYGNDHILLGADAKDGKVAIDGWLTSTEISIADLLSRYAASGVDEVFVTDIGRDGALAGPAIELYERIISLLPGVRLIASGGVRSIRDVEELDRIGCAGVIVGKALYEGRITIEELSNYAR